MEHWIVMEYDTPTQIVIAPAEWDSTTVLNKSIEQMLAEARKHEPSRTEAYYCHMYLHGPITPTTLS